MEETIIWGPKLEPGQEFNEETRMFLRMPLTIETITSMQDRLKRLSTTEQFVNDRCMRDADQCAWERHEKANQELRRCIKFGLISLDMLVFMMGSHERVGKESEIRTLPSECLVKILDQYALIH
jgi:hypothetical protein